MKRVPLPKTKSQKNSQAASVESSVAQLSIVNTVQPEINETNAEDAMSNDLARVQDILFGNTIRQFEQKLIELNLDFRKATEQLQEQFNSSVAALREEARLAGAEQQQLLADNRAEVMACIAETAAKLGAAQLQSEKQSAVALASTRKSLEGQLSMCVAELQNSQAAMQESKVDRTELASLLGQMAEQLRMEDVKIQKDSGSRKP